MIKLQHLRKQCYLAEKLWRTMSFNTDKVTVTVEFSANHEKSVHYAKLKKYIKLTFWASWIVRIPLQKSGSIISPLISHRQVDSRCLTTFGNFRFRSSEEI